jgi:peptidoglycan biosynthesis protein MviN/MurJ (putative lipid II flippase)
MMISFLSIGVNAGLNFLFTQMGYGFRGLALSTGCVAILNFVLLYWFMRKEISGIATRRLLVVFAKVFLASDALALVCWGCDWLMLSHWAEMGFVFRVLALLITIGLAMGAFALVASLLGLHEMRDLLGALQRKFRGKRAAR